MFGSDYALYRGNTPIIIDNAVNAIMGMYVVPELSTHTRSAMTVNRVTDGGYFRVKGDFIMTPR
jgi:hypothetical protein